MKRWTNGLPGATKGLGANLALRGLSVSQSGCARIPMMARSKIAPLQRPNTLMQLSRSSVLELPLATRGRAIHTGTSWSQPDVLVCKALKSGPCRPRSTISNTNSVRLPVYTLRFPAVSRLRRGKSKTPPACDWRAKQGALPNLGDIFAYGGGSKSPGVACACSYG